MQNRFSTSLLAAFGALTILFVSFTFLGTWLGEEIEARFEAASTNALPSIVRLTAACDRLRDLETEADDYPDAPDEERAKVRASLEQHRRALEAELTAYAALPDYAGERALYEASVPVALREVDASLHRLDLQVAAGQLVVARVTADREVRQSSNRAAGQLRAMVSFNAKHAQLELDRIITIHRSAARRAMLLAGLATLSSVLLAVWVLRRFREHDRLYAAHNALVAERADELEVFAQRVAHDLLSPLSALTYCLSAFKRVAAGDSALQDALVRARSCVGRAQGMVHGIFEFARAGGQPAPGGRAALREVVGQVALEMRDADAGEHPQITIEPFEDRVVGCPPGVLSSVLGNLLRNAAKFMSDSAVKEITVRVDDDGGFARVEVEDTGPGVPAGLRERIFEPYVRGEGVTQPGLGLGLATVKRLCEAHGGAVGVTSTPGQGSVFWFTLPLAPDIRGSSVD